MPSWVPIKTPPRTAKAYKNIAFGIKLTEVIFPKRPDIELNKINAAAVPEAPFTLVQPKKTINGDRKIPPPVPVSPEINPIMTPANSPNIKFTG